MVAVACSATGSGTPEGTWGSIKAGVVEGPCSAGSVAQAQASPDRRSTNPMAADDRDQDDNPADPEDPSSSAPSQACLGHLQISTLLPGLRCVTVARSRPLRRSLTVVRSNRGGWAGRCCELLGRVTVGRSGGWHPGGRVRWLAEANGVGERG